MKNVGNIEAQDLQEIIRESRKLHFRSNFCFLNHHNGLRKGNVHVLMGTSGCGKSTFIRSIMNDFLSENLDNAIFWLSEESSKDLIVSMFKQGGEKENLKNLTVYSELENREDTLEDVFEKVKFLAPSFLVIDNITTSKFYMDMRPNEQSNIITKLKNFADENNIALVLVAHTKKDIHDNFSRIITEGDIRGSGSPVMMSEFFYIMQKFETNGVFFPTLRIVKHRGQEVSEKLYSLLYDSSKSSYVKDIQIDFNRFKEVFNQRDKL